MYSTIEQANVYISNYYGSTDTIRTSWEALSDEDKQVYLNKAEQIIDQLLLKGRPLVPGKAFPRDPDSEVSLLKAQEATIELAVQTQGNIEAKERYNLQKQGVSSYKIGDLSESFKGNGSDLMGVDKFALSIVYPFLKDWLSGGYKICGTQIKR